MQKKLCTNLFIIVLVGGILFTSCKSRKILADTPISKSESFSGKYRDKYSTLLGVSKNQIENEKLYQFIDDWMGVPHLDGGWDKEGIDCSGFTNLLIKEIYKRPLLRTARLMAEQVKRKFENELQEGDLVFFDFNGQKFNHVGVYLQNNKFVHASTSKGVIISNLKDSWYYKYFSRAGSIHY